MDVTFIIHFMLYAGITFKVSSRPCLDANCQIQIVETALDFMEMCVDAATIFYTLSPSYLRFHAIEMPTFWR
jgi:hypothetical protein